MHEGPMANRLIAETSPYLLQHAHNPVDWFPWGEEALEKARREDKPVLLSIGYSACHWCHVMAHESFEDEATAAVMNERFVNIKVDREERPDLDKIYQLSHQILARRAGGWPLTVFIDPHDQMPFFTGTYFPKESRYNLPGFVPLLRQVADYFAANRVALTERGRAFADLLNSLSAGQQSGASGLDVGLLQRARDALDAGFDARWGGFGGAPKFPHASDLDLLLRCWHRSAGQDDAALNMVLQTLTKMAEGGLYDQLGGGFCRYSVDAQWQIPHFEKMLYDNGSLLTLYCQAWQITGDALFRRIAEQTGDWVLREMQSPEGGYFSSLDADSEGEEGRFYVWDRRDVQVLLEPREYDVVRLRYGLDQAPNFEGRWHLCITMALPDVAARLGLSIADAESALTLARNKLFAARTSRVRPGLDDKLLTSWNGLMIKAMAFAGRVLQRQDFIDSAWRAAEFVYGFLWRDGRLLATYKDGRAHLAAYLDDYAFMLDACLELVCSRWDGRILRWATALADDLIARFEDRRNGGFFFTADDHESLIYRPKPMSDEAMPSGNGVAVSALIRLGHLIGEQRYVDAAERVLRAGAAVASEHPQAHAALLNGLDDWLDPAQIILLRGEPDEMAAWLQATNGVFHPKRLCVAIPADDPDLIGTLAERKPQGVTVAYVCEASHCLPPLTARQDFDALVSSGSAGQWR